MNYGYADKGRTSVWSLLWFSINDILHDCTKSIILFYGSCIPVSAPNGIYFLAAVCIGSYTKYCDLYSGGSGFGKNSFKGRNYR